MLKSSTGHKILTYRSLAEQEKTWRDSVDATGWLDEVDSFAAITKLHKWGSQVQRWYDKMWDKTSKIHSSCERMHLVALNDKCQKKAQMNSDDKRYVSN